MLGLGQPGAERCRVVGYQSAASGVLYDRHKPRAAQRSPLGNLFLGVGVRLDQIGENGEVVGEVQVVAARLGNGHSVGAVLSLRAFCFAHAQDFCHCASGQGDGRSGAGRGGGDLKHLSACHERTRRRSGRSGQAGGDDRGRIAEACSGGQVYGQAVVGAVNDQIKRAGLLDIVKRHAAQAGRLQNGRQCGFFGAGHPQAFRDLGRALVAEEIALSERVFVRQQAEHLADFCGAAELAHADNARRSSWGDKQSGHRQRSAARPNRAGNYANNYASGNRVKSHLATLIYWNDCNLCTICKVLRVSYHGIVL